DGLAGVGLPLVRERIVELGVQLAGGVVGDVEQFGALRRGGAAGGGESEQQRGEDGPGLGVHGRVSDGGGQNANCARVKNVLSSSRSAPSAAPPPKPARLSAAASATAPVGHQFSPSDQAPAAVA